MVKNGVLLALLASLNRVVSAASEDDVVTCVETTGENVITNPSWESGTSGWTYNYSPTTTNTYSSDGSYSLLITGTYLSAAYVRQSISDLQVGQTYDISFDLKGVVNPLLSITETCYLYVYHDSLTTSNLITTSSKTYTRTSTDWVTYGGTVTPTSNTMLFGIVLECSPYRSQAIFNAYLDNVVMQAPSQSCTTSVLSTSTSTPTPSSIASISDSSSAPEVTAVSVLSSSATSSVGTGIVTSDVPAATSSTTSNVGTGIVTSDVPAATSSTTSSVNTGIIASDEPAVTVSTISIVGTGIVASDEPAVTVSTINIVGTGIVASDEPAVTVSTINIVGTGIVASDEPTVTASSISVFDVTSSLPETTAVDTISPTPPSSTVSLTDSSSSVSTLLSDSSILTASAAPPSSANTIETISGSQVSSSTPVTLTTPSVPPYNSGFSATSILTATISPSTSASTIGAVSNSQASSQPLSMTTPSIRPSNSSISATSSVLSYITHRNSSGSFFPTTTTGSVTLSQTSTSLSGASSGAGLTPSSPPVPTSQSSGGATAVASEGGEQLTTLTVLATATQTILSCAPAVTNCPANPASLSSLASSSPEQVSTILVTDTVVLSTTVCPVSAAGSISSSIVSAAMSGSVTGLPLLPSEAASAGESLTTLTVLTTSTHTVLSCAPTITNCPSGSSIPTDLPEGVSTVVVTETIELTTTICPVTAAEAISSSILSIAATGGITGKTLVPSQTPSAGEALTTLTVLTTSVHTSIRCAPTVTDCPTGSTIPTSLAKGVSTVVVTETIELSTTICPVTAAEAVSSSILSVAATGGVTGKTLVPSQTPSAGEALTTLTVLATSTRTAISCAPTITHCPGRNMTASLTKLPEGMKKVLITETIELFTTVCPVTAVESISSSILSLASREGIGGKTIVPSLIPGGSPALPTSSGTGPGSEATNSAVESISTRIRTQFQMTSAHYPTAIPTTLEPVTIKACDSD